MLICDLDREAYDGAGRRSPCEGYPKMEKNGESLKSARGSNRHELIDVAEPNLLREIFPYDAVPRIIFDGVIENPEPAPDFFITDTTFRDGQQARPPYTVEQIVAMFDLLHLLSGPIRIIPPTVVLFDSKTDRE